MSDLKDLAALQVRFNIAKKALDTQHALVKKHHNEVYMPMYEEKKRLKEEFEAIADELRAAVVDNAEIFELLKSIRKG